MTRLTRVSCNAERDCRGTRVACEKVAAGTAAATDAASPKSAKPIFLCTYVFHIALADARAEAEEEGEEAVNPFGCYFFRRSSLPACRNPCQKAPEVNLNHPIEAFLLLQ